MQFTIAIDGPAAAGKGTIARALADRLGLAYLDTGLLYRATALRTLSGENPVTAAENLQETDLAKPGLRAPDISQEASRVSAIPEVRAALVRFQKDFAKREGGAVLDGRDIGTVICPDADIKLFLTASDAVRARRRHAELAAQGRPDSYEEVLEEMRIRDRRDSTRASAPLKPARDAIIIDTSDMSIEDCLALASQHVARARAA